MQKERIGYIDLVKGFCMFFVISFHCHVTYCPWFYDFIRSIYLPAFFFCSALFFKSSVPVGQFVLRKVNLLLVPWCFFMLVCLAGYTAVYLAGAFFPANDVGWQSVFGQYTPFKFFMQPANLPTWYLWCIFTAFMVYYAVDRFCGKRPLYVKALAIVLLSAAGFYLEQTSVRRALFAVAGMEWLYGLHVFTALEMLPFMFAGEELRKRGLLEMRFNNLRGMAFMTVCLLVWCVSSQRVYVSLFGHAWPAEAYVTSFAAIGFLFASASVIKRLPLLNFLGRYSLTALCTHYMIYEACAYYISNPWLLLAAVVVLTVAAVGFLVKYCPAFTGQRNLIPLTAFNVV